MADQNAITSDELGQVCQVVGIVRAPTRKHERIDALAAVFVDDRDRVLATLSDRARALLTKIADVGGPRVLDVASVGLVGSEYSLNRASTPRFAFARDRSNVPDEVGAPGRAHRPRHRGAQLVERPVVDLAPGLATAGPTPVR